jgi:YVTN family beta-propeller protein
VAYLSDQKRAKLMQRGDRAAVEAFLLQHRMRLYRYLCRLLDDPLAAERATQEAFRRFTRQVTAPRGNGSSGDLTALLFRVATRPVVRPLPLPLFRRSRRQAQASGPQSAVAVQVGAAMAALSLEQRAALLLDALGIATDELGSILGLRPERARAVLDRAWERFMAAVATTGVLVTRAELPSLRRMVRQYLDEAPLVGLAAPQPLSRPRPETQKEQAAPIPEEPLAVQGGSIDAVVLAAPPGTRLPMSRLFLYGAGLMVALYAMLYVAATFLPQFSRNVRVPSNRIWVGQEFAGLAALDTKTNYLTEPPQFAFRARTIAQAADATRGRLYVALASATASRVLALDMVDQKILQNIWINETITGLAFDERRNRLYITGGLAPNATGYGFVSVFDPSTATLITRFALSGRPWAVLVSPDGSRLYLSLHTTGTLLVLDADTGRTLKAVPLGPQPRGMALSPDGKRLYVAVTDASDVYAVNTSTLEVEQSITVGRGAVALAPSPDGARLYVVDQLNGYLHVVDLVKRVELERVYLGDQPSSVLVRGDGRRIYVSVTGNNTIAVLDARSNTVVDTIATRGRPVSLATF